MIRASIVEEMLNAADYQRQWAKDIRELNGSGVDAQQAEKTASLLFEASARLLLKEAPASAAPPTCSTCAYWARFADDNTPPRDGRALGTCMSWSIAADRDKAKDAAFSVGCAMGLDTRPQIYTRDDFACAQHAKKRLGK